MEEVLRVRKAVLAPSTRAGYYRAFARFFMWLLDPPPDEPALPRFIPMSGVVERCSIHQQRQATETYCVSSFG